ncbi:MAG: hypothetical protein XD73_0782 [Anaerolinea thermophila]|uniref:Uncharacterized protein n=1 Tax=Anaerolinea thermophila TaxID=167964 RepID=A0A101FXN4_9CHLR|nr:MAG: hypothetical protein XD73_0782 [Anaerolinea thermophila]
MHAKTIKAGKNPTLREFCGACSHMRQNKKGGKESRPTGILGSAFSCAPKQKRRERIPPYGNLGERVSMRAKTIKAGENPALREFWGARFHAR